MKISHYQNITGEKGEDPKRKDSFYWNEGKWKHYIEPLLPTENRKDSTFLDIGANNGLFCKLATDAGYKNVIGIEADEDAVERGNKWKEDNGYNFNLIGREIGKDFSFDELPLADLTLLSNVHYYFQLKDWLKFLDELYWKTEYCLIITRPIKVGNRADWRPLTSIDAIKHYFKDWELVRARYKARQNHMEYKDDPSPRVLHAMLFRSRLRRKRFDELIPGATADPIKIDRSGFIKDIIDGVSPVETQYYRDWKDRMYPKNWSAEELVDYVQNKYLLVDSIIRDGVRDPILIAGDNKTIDGKHRIAVLKELGYESAICRMI